MRMAAFPLFDCRNEFPDIVGKFFPNFKQTILGKKSQI